MASRIILAINTTKGGTGFPYAHVKYSLKDSHVCNISKNKTFLKTKVAIFSLLFTLCPGLQKRFHRYLKMHLYVLEYILVTNQIFNTRRCYLMSSDTNSLAHTKWNCKYHIVFAPKYRRQVIYGKIKGILELFCVNYVKEKA